MIPEPIGELLDELYERYDTPGFIEDDPISVPHQASRAGRISRSPASSPRR